VPLQLQQIRVVGADYNSYASYHRGDQIDLQAHFYDATGQAIQYTAHPAVYLSSYRLLNTAVPYTSWATVGMQQTDQWVTIPMKAPLGTYKYWFTLVVYGYPTYSGLHVFYDQSFILKASWPLPVSDMKPLVSA
jgi:hypothetical protein